MRKIYSSYHHPEAYPEYTRRLIRATTRDTLENTVQFMSLRDLPHTVDGTLLEIDEALDLYTKRFDLGKVFWLRANAVYAPNLRDLLRAVNARGGYVFDLWGFVPGSYKKGLDWGEYTVTDEQHAAFCDLLGDRFIGYDNGEQDGRYIGSYTPTQCPARQDNVFQQRRFYEFFDEMGGQLKHATTALCSLNYVHFFAREQNCFMLGAETAQALPNANLWYAYIRGAGKQYGLLWFGNASVYNRFSWKSYDIESTGVDKEGYSYGPTAGTSLSLLRRLMYVEYLYNSDMLGFESGLISTRECMDKVNAGIPLEPNRTTSDKSLFTGDDAVLAPIGQIQADCIRFVKERGYAGVMAVPTAIVLNSGNGWCMPRHLYTRNVYRSWGQMPYKDCDHQLHALFTLLYPGYEDSGFFLNERGFLTPTPYGDQADVLMTDARAETLRQYDLLLLAGWQKLDREQLDKLTAFADNGGTILAFAGQLEDAPEAAAFFGVNSLGKSALRCDALITGSDGKTCRERALSVYADAALSDADVLMTLEDGTPFVIAKPAGKGRALLVLSPYGLDETENPAPVRNMENVSIPLRRDLLESVKALLGRLMDEERLVSVDNPALQTIVNIRDEHTLTVTIVNNGFSTESYRLSCLCGKELSRREIAVPDLDPATPGYWPMYTHPYPAMGAVDEGRALIGPGQIAMWDIEYEPENVAFAHEEPMRDLSGNVYVALRPHGILIEELLKMPALNQYFAGVKLDAAYVSDLSLRQCEQAGGWFKRRGLDVVVDFASVLDHYPHLSLIRNMPERQDAKFQWMDAIMTNAAALGAKRILLNHHRNAENHLTLAEAAEHMRAAIDALSAMAEKHGLTVMLTNALPNAVEGRVEHVERDAAHPAALNLAHCLLCGDIPTNAQLKTARALLLSAPLRDDFGQLIDAHAPLYDSPLAPRVADLLRGLALDQYDFVCLDGDYSRFDEMYLDRLWLNDSAK